MHGAIKGTHFFMLIFMLHVAVANLLVAMIKLLKRLKMSRMCAHLHLVSSFVSFALFSFCVQLKQNVNVIVADTLHIQ